MPLDGNNPANQTGRGKLRALLDILLILATLSIIILEFNAIWIMLPLLVFYIWLIEDEIKPKPKTVKRWNKQAGKYIYYEIDEKTGQYLKKVDK